MKVDGQTVYVHRLVYEELVGPIPDGHQIDHLCRVRLCGNPAHLEAVEGLENVHRGLAVRYRTHCRNGHPINEENTYI
ncbi:MAG: HNH endonuclease signature motif containing protein, partial [Actinomycetota bacterium]